MLWHFSSVKLLTFFGILSCSFDFCSIYHNLVMKSSFGKSAQKKVVKDHTCPLFCTIPFNSTTILIERNVLHLEMSSGIIFCCCSFQRRASSISLLTALTPPIEHLSKMVPPRDKDFITGKRMQMSDLEHKT